MAVVPVVPGAVRWIESLDGAHALLIVEHSGSIELLLQQGKNILFSVLGCKAEDCISSLASLGGEELSFPPVLRDVILKKGGDGFIGQIPEGYKMQGCTAIGVGTNRIKRLRALSLSLVLSAGCLSPEIRSDIARAEEAYPGIVAACNAAANAWGAPEAASDQKKDTNAWGRSEAAEAAANAWGADAWGLEAAEAAPMPSRGLTHRRLEKFMEVRTQIAKAKAKAKRLPRGFRPSRDLVQSLVFTFGLGLMEKQ